MSDQHLATEPEVLEILHQRVTDVARRMMAKGVRLTWAQREEIGDAGDGWLRGRLGLSLVTTDGEGVSYDRPEVQS